MGLRGASILAGLGQGLNQGIMNFVNIRRMLSDEKLRRGQLQAMAEFDAPPNMVDVGETIDLPPGATGGNVPASVLASPRNYSEMDLGELMHLSTLGNLRRQKAKETREEQEKNKDMQPVTLPEIRMGDRPAAKGDISEIIREAVNQYRQTEGFSLLSPDEAASMIPDQQGYGDIKGKTIAPEMTVPRVALEDARNIRGKIAESALTTKKPEKMDGPFSKIEPHHYTPESIAKFNQTGNHADLIPREKETTKKGLGDASESDFRSYLSMAQGNALKAMKFNDPSQLSILMAISSNPEQAGVLMGQLERSMTPEQRQQYQSAVNAYIETYAPDTVVEAYRTRTSRPGAAAPVKPEADPNDPLGFFNRR